MGIALGCPRCGITKIIPCCFDEGHWHTLHECGPYYCEQGHWSSPQELANAKAMDSCGCPIPHGNEFTPAYAINHLAEMGTDD